MVRAAESVQHLLLLLHTFSDILYTNSYQCILGAFHIERVSDGWNGVGNKHD